MLGNEPDYPFPVLAYGQTSVSNYFQYSVKATKKPGAAIGVLRTNKYNKGAGSDDPARVVCTNHLSEGDGLLEVEVKCEEDIVG